MQGARAHEAHTPLRVDGVTAHMNALSMAGGVSRHRAHAHTHTRTPADTQGHSHSLM